MEIDPAQLTGGWMIGGYLLFATVLLLAVRRAPWSWLWRSGAANRLAAMTAAVLAVWQIRAAPGTGPALHLLGATALTLSFGWQLAVLALGLVLAVMTAVHEALWHAAGLNGLTNVVLPVAVSYSWARVSETWLPRHFFVYVFSAAFFGAALAVAAGALAACGVLDAAGRMSRHELLDNYLPTTLLLLFPEAFLTGALVTLAAVYRPHWLVSFSDARYVDGR